jgi:uncharacterized ferritin-like protein (DUF455 family)
MKTAVNFYELAEDCLYTPRIEDKLAAVDLAATQRAEGTLAFGPARPPRPASQVRFPERPPQVEPRNLPRRSLATAAGRAALLHAVAHIEFTAIHLALDLAYRFRDMPDGFRQDWLGVAIEEASHFRLLCGRLRDFGADYGHLPVHRGLWELAEDTAGDLLHRLALVPRFMEARGLDVTPGMIARLKAVDDPASIAILEVILREEIGHVSLGSRWFREVCQSRGLDPETAYFALVRQYIRGAVRGPFNHTARRAAGFSPAELARLESLDGAGEAAAPP